MVAAMVMDQGALTISAARGADRYEALRRSLAALTIGAMVLAVVGIGPSADRTRSYVSRALAPKSPITRLANFAARAKAPSSSMSTARTMP